MLYNYNLQEEPLEESICLSQTHKKTPSEAAGSEPEKTGQLKDQPYSTSKHA